MIHELLRKFFLNVLITLTAIAILSVDSITMAQMPVESKSVKHAVTSAQSHGAAPSQVSPPGTNAGRAVLSARPMALLDADPLNDNLPYFLPPVYYPAADYTGGIPLTAVVIADLNGDGYPDIVAATVFYYPFCGNGTGGTLEVLLGNGDGTLQLPVTYCSGGDWASSVTVADVNGDGKPDLVVANVDTAYGNHNGSVGMLLGNGDGTFQPAVTYYSGGGQAWSVAVADVNRDGKIDLVAANYDDNSIGVLLGNGDGTFQPALTYGSGGSGGSIAVSVADVNGDYKPDLLVALSSNNRVGVLLGNGDGTFQTALPYDSGGSGPVAVAVADVNRDGKPDLLVTTPGSGTVSVLLGNSGGTLQKAVAYNSGGSNPVAVVVADVNGDGKLDLLLGNSGIVAVLLGNGDGTFQTALAYYSGGSGPQAVADLNRDKSPDLVDVSVSGGGTTVGVMLHVGDLPTNTEVVSSPNPSVFGESVTLTATVDSSSAVPAGTVAYFGNSTGLGSASLANGVASLPASALVVGSNSVTAVYQGSVELKPSASAPLNQVVTMATTTTSVAPSQNPILINKPVTYTAYVASKYAGAATGTVTFQEGGVALATATVAHNCAAYTASYKARGTHAITGIYSGDSNSLGSVSATLVEQVSGFATQTRLTTSGSPSYIGQPVTFTASVTYELGAIPDRELVTFYDGMTAMASVPLASGTATYTTSSLSGGKKHYVTAKYAGDSILMPSSYEVVQEVERYSTNTTVSASLNPSSYGQAVTWTATVTSSGSVPPTGKVNFTWGYNIGTVTINTSGVATLTRSNLNADSYPLKAVYLGDASNSGSTSAVLNQVVTQATTSATLTSSPNPSSSGQVVTFIATISSPAVLPTGPVTFAVGKTVLGTTQLSGGKAKFIISTLAVGATKVTATYYGNSNVAKSSASVTQTVR